MRSALLALIALFAGTTGAQEPASADESGPNAPRQGNELAYPRDEDRVVAEVNGEELTLGDLVRHLTERHAPDMDTFLRTPAGAHYFDSAWPARWVRHFADIKALETEALSRKLDVSKADAALSAALERAFEAYMEPIRERRERLGRPLTQRAVDIHLDKFQRERGLQTEVQGWLDFLVPDQFSEKELYAFFTDHAHVFGGYVTFSHILVRHRHPVTLELLRGEARRRATEKIIDVRARLKEDGSNFEDVARALSDDRKTAPRGGILEDVARFEPALPAILCRTAWGLEDGEWTGPVESPYGMHFVKRIRLRRDRFLLYTDETEPRIRRALRKLRQEDLIFRVREERRVELLY